MHDFLKPKTGPLGLVDYEKVFCPLAGTDQDVFELRRIDRGSGALVVRRPDRDGSHTGLRSCWCRP
jgi:phenol 2-monooxygenase (NADPH)